MSKNLIITEPKFISPRWQEILPQTSLHFYGQTMPDSSSETLIWILTSDQNWQSLCKQYSQNQSKVIVMSKEPSADELKQALQCGARGYIHALSNKDVLKKVESSIRQGARWLPGSLFNELMSLLVDKQNKIKTPNLNKILTPKEIEITHLITQGLNNKSIAEKMAITERTVKAHLTHIFSKMKVKDRLQLSLKAKDAI